MPGVKFLDVRVQCLSVLDLVIGQRRFKSEWSALNAPEFTDGAVANRRPHAAGLGALQYGID
jgi:hypothetical protein